MRFRGFSARDRLAAVCALLALAVVLLGSTGGLTADTGTEAESCVGCTRCESGRCGEGGDEPLTSHHHCCITCCFSHAPLTLAIESSTQVPAIAGSLSVNSTVAVVGGCLDAPYRPPRV